MGDEYQLRRDIDKLYDKTYDFENNSWDIYTKKEIAENYYDKGQVDELVSQGGGGGGDLSNYVRKDDLIDNTKYDIDLDLSFGTSGFDDTITINMDIVDYIVSKIINIGEDNDGD